MSPHVVVVGAGITGLATTVALQRRGHRVTLVEERADASAGSAITLWPNALAALDEIGLGEAVRNVGARVTAGAMRWSDGHWLRRPTPERITRALGEPLVVVRRSTLIDVLAAAIEPGTLETGSAATKLMVTAAGVQVVLSDGSSRTGDAVVGADGTGSMVARHLNGPLRHRYTGYTAWRGIATRALDGELAGETLGNGIQFGHVPLGPEHTYWFGTGRRPAGSASPEGELEHLRSTFSTWAEPIPALLRATDPSDVLRNDLYDRGVARRWSGGPVVVVGDAAHPMRPHLGQGGCQGLEDAAVLAHCVGAGTDLPGAFSDFERHRRPRATAVAGRARLIGRLVDVRPALLGGALVRSSSLVPETLLMRQLATIAGRAAFVLPAVSGLR